MQNPSSYPTQTLGTNNNKPQPITGWLAVFVFGLLVGTLYNLYEFFIGWSTLSQITPDVSATYPGLRSLVLTEQFVQLGIALLGIYLLYLVYKRSHLVKSVGIVLLAGSLLWFVLDMGIAQSIFANNNEVLKQINNISPTQSRSILLALIWLLYLIFSKAVRRVFNR